MEDGPTVASMLGEQLTGLLRARSGHLTLGKLTNASVTPACL